MTCEESEILLHALLDDELDAGHAREVEAHVAACPGCAAQLHQFRALRTAMSAKELRFSAPASLRTRLDAVIPTAPLPVPSRRMLLKGFALGSMVSAAVAASFVITVVRSDQDQRVFGEVVSAHLRSLQAEHLIDVQTSDQHTVKPWFNGRLDYVDGRAVAAIVYRRRNHVINLFVAQSAGSERSAKAETVQGFNIRFWSEQGLNFWAVSDLNTEDLQDFVEKFQRTARAGA